MDSLKSSLRRTGNILLMACVVFSFSLSSCVSKDIPAGKVENIKHFLKKIVKDYWEEDYRRHNMNIKAEITGIKIEKITRKETRVDNEYFVQGSVSYIIRGNRRWTDKEGNVVELDPEREITHWFSCGVLEDNYIQPGALRKDNDKRLTFYADNPVK